MKKTISLIALLLVVVMIYLTVEKDAEGEYYISFFSNNKPKPAAHKFEGRRDEAEPVIQLKNQDNKPYTKHDQEQVRIQKEGYGRFPQIDISDPSKLSPQQRYVVNALKDPVNNGGAFSIVGKRKKLNC